MPVSNGSTNTSNHKKQRKWSLVGILSKKKKLKKSQESVDFCPYDGKINQKVAQNNHLKRSTDCIIEQYTCSPRLIRKCNSLQYTSQVPVCSNITSQPSLNEWKSSQQSIYSSSSSACYSDIGVYGNRGSSQQSSYYIKEKNDLRSPVLQKVPFRCSSENSYYQNKINHNQKYLRSINQPKLIGKKIPPPPPPRNPNVKAVYYFRNNRLMSRESDSTYFSQGSDDNIPDKDEIHKYEEKYQNDYYIKEPPRSRRPIQICDVETLSTESENSVPRTQSVEEALQELEDIYNSLGLSDEDLLDRAERRDLPTIHQNMRYQNFDELDCLTVTRVLPKTRRSGVPDIISDDMAYRRLNKKEPKRQNFIPGSFLLVLPTVYNVDRNPKLSKEPDVTLDDVVFRSRRQHLNFLKIPDPQPPFGIPLGPIIGATSSDYLHAVPEGRYKPSFHPRKVPDTVEDDLAFRTLRKDNKYKTCIDFSFIHRNRLKIDNQTSNLSGSNRIKNDTHWIVKKTNSDRTHSKSQVKFMFDDLVDSIGVNNQNVMVVKINHHKQIMLTGFTFNEANRLSKSYFHTNLSQHESRKLCLTNDTHHTPNRTAQLKSQCSLNALNKPNVNTLPVALNHPAINHRTNTVAFKTVNCKGKKSSPRVQYTRLDNDGLMYKSIDGPASQPNFRELIKREYAHRYMLTENLSNADFIPYNRIRVMSVTEKRAQDEFEHRSTNNDRTTGEADLTESIAVKRKSQGTCNEDERLSFEPTSISIANATIKQTEMCKDSSSSVSTGILSTEYPNRMPGYLEVCLYIAVYIYQLLSVNAYSTFIALIFLIALHLCRRLS